MSQIFTYLSDEAVTRHPLIWLLNCSPEKQKCIYIIGRDQGQKSQRPQIQMLAVQLSMWSCDSQRAYWSTNTRVFNKLRGRRGVHSPWKSFFVGMPHLFQMKVSLLGHLVQRFLKFYKFQNHLFHLPFTGKTRYLKNMSPSFIIESKEGSAKLSYIACEDVCA